GRRTRHPPLIALHAPAPHLDADAGAGAVLDEKPRAEPHQLGLKTRALRFRQCQLFIASSERRRDLTRTADCFQRIVWANSRAVSRPTVCQASSLYPWRASSFQLPSCFCQTCSTPILTLLGLPSISLSETWTCP